MFPLKLQFFKDIASHFRGFLEIMQTDKPMVPFMDEVLVDTIFTLMKIIVKPGLLEKSDTSFKLVKIDLSNFENLLPCELFKLPKALLKSEMANQKSVNF